MTEQISMSDQSTSGQIPKKSKMTDTLFVLIMLGILGILIVVDSGFIQELSAV